MPRKTRNYISTEPPETQQQTWNIAVYIRLSREDGNIESESVVNQKKILDEYLADFFEGEYTIADYYVDDGLTGTDDTRADFMRMISNIEQGKVNCVLVKTLSRAFRNYSDQGYYLEYYFPLKKVRFISTGGPKVDTFLDPDAITGMEVPITGLMNDRFAARTSADIRRTFNMKRRKGEFIGSFAPYGYLKDPNNKNALIVDEYAAQVVRNIFHWFVNDGMSKRGIALKLNELGEPNPAKYKKKLGLNYHTRYGEVNDGFWGSQTVNAILQNEVYTGAMVQGRYKVVSYKVHKQIRMPEKDWFIVPDTHEAIIDRETFDKAKSLCRRDTRTPNKSGKVHMFAGFLRCADCKKAMERHGNRGHVYYTCSSHVSKRVCSGHSIREDRLKSAILRAIQTQIELAKSLKREVERINASPTVRRESARLQNLLETAKRQFAQNSNATDSLYLDWKSEEITQEEYRRLKGKLTEQSAQLRERIAKLEKEVDATSQGIGLDNPYFAEFLKEQNVETLTRGLIVELVSMIWVHENGVVTVEFNFADQYERITEYIESNPAAKTAKQATATA
jgi:hypothetical protein